MKRIHTAFSPPPRSSRRNTSRKHETKIHSTISQKKKNVMARIQSPKEFTSYLLRPRVLPGAL